MRVLLGMICTLFRIHPLSFPFTVTTRTFRNFRFLFFLFFFLLFSPGRGRTYSNVKFFSRYTYYIALCACYEYVHGFLVVVGENSPCRNASRVATGWRMYEGMLSPPDLLTRADDLGTEIQQDPIQGAPFSKLADTPSQIEFQRLVLITCRTFFPPKKYL